MVIDYKAIDRLVGPHVAERFGLVTEEQLSDLAAPSALLAMAVEQAAETGQSVAETMTVLLDAIDAEGASV
jgi:hypothetical protein